MNQISSNPCSCHYNQQEVASHAILTFTTQELIYDIGNNCFIEGHVMDPQTQHARHTTQDVVQEGNIDRVIRLLDLYHAEVVEMLYPYSKYPVITAKQKDDEHPWHDKLEQKQQYQIHLLLPKEFSHTTLDLLEYLIHEYLVCRVTSEWLSITNPQKSVYWLEKAESTKADIRSIMNNRRSNRTRLKLHPF